MTEDSGVGDFVGVFSVFTFLGSAIKIGEGGMAITGFWIVPVMYPVIALAPI